MELLIAADIFGHTPALERLAKKLGATQILDPYDGKACFENEAKAYEFFNTRVGISAYADTIAARLGKGPPIQAIIGFSVGAAAIWQLSGNPAFATIQQAVGFYGSQIRHSLHIRPVFNMQLFFPASEPHFDVDGLIVTLEKIPKVYCHKTGGHHGFMNERSENFDECLYKTYLEKLNGNMTSGL